MFWNLYYHRVPGAGVRDKNSTDTHSVSALSLSYFQQAEQNCLSCESTSYQSIVFHNMKIWHPVSILNEFVTRPPILEDRYHYNLQDM